MRKLLYFLLLCAILVGLFFSSGQTYEQQSLIPTLENSLPNKPLKETLSKLEVPYWGKTISVEERGYYHFVEFLLRKSAHFVIFGLLAVAIYAILPRSQLRLLTAAVITFLFAIGDEYHQSLTGGRTPSWQDVFLDMSGALTFLIIFRILAFLRRGIRKRTRKRRK